ncbi:MAG: hypothetical protein OHK0052_10290 [Anaerolineales bacterium]
MDLVKRLYDEGEKVVAFFDGLSPEDWEKIIYADGEVWTLHHLLRHFVSSEVSMTQLVSAIVAGGSGAAEDFDIDRFNQRKVTQLAGHSTAALLAQLREARAATVALAQELTPADLQKVGRHPFLGVTTVEEILKLMYRHQQIHLRDVRKA